MSVSSTERARQSDETSAAEQSTSRARTSTPTYEHLGSRSPCCPRSGGLLGVRARPLRRLQTLARLAKLEEGARLGRHGRTVVV